MATYQSSHTGAEIDAAVDEVAEKLPLTGGTLTGELVVEDDITATGSITAPSFVGDVTGNASTATKLSTPRSIWGQSFDGSSFVRGTLSMFPDSLGMNNDTAKLWFRSNTSTAGDGYSPYIQGIFQAGTGRKRLSVFQINDGSSYTSQHKEVFTILPSGNVGIGTVTPSALLEVNGSVAVSSLTIGGNAAVSVLSGSTAPSSSTGSNGDIYIQTS